MNDDLIWDESEWHNLEKARQSLKEHDMNQPYDEYGKLEDPMGVLGVALAQWETRDDSRPQPEIRKAASTAVDAIDAMLRELYLMRGRLIGEIRVSDDAAARRAGELSRQAAAQITEENHG